MRLFAPIQKTSFCIASLPKGMRQVVAIALPGFDYRFGRLAFCLLYLASTSIFRIIKAGNAKRLNFFAYTLLSEE